VYINWSEKRLAKHRWLIRGNAYFTHYMTLSDTGRNTICSTHNPKVVGSNPAAATRKNLET